MNKVKSMALSLALVCCFFGLVAQTPEWQWAVQGGGWYPEGGGDMALDSQGNMYVTGSFGGTKSFGPYYLTSSGTSDIFVAKLDANGNWLWARRAGGSSSDYSSEQAYGIAVDGVGNSYLTGYFGGSYGEGGSATFGSTTLVSSGGADIFVAKLDTAGNWLWARKAGGSYEDGYYSDIGYSIAVDSVGNASLTGHYDGSASFGPYTVTSSAEYITDIFVARIDAAGNWLWAVRAGGQWFNDNIGYGIALDGSGNTYVTGKFGTNASFGPFTLTVSGVSDIFVAKLDTAGNWLWAVRAGGTNQDEGYGIAVDGTGNAYLTGYFLGTASFGPYTLTSSGYYDVFAAKLNSTGNWLWAVRAGGTGFDWGFDIAVDGAGYACLTGSFRGSASFGSTTLTSSGWDDVFAAKLDAAGNWLWAVKAGGSLVDQGYGISLDSAGNALITGIFTGPVPQKYNRGEPLRGSATFGPYTLTTVSGGAIFVAKLSTQGAIPKSPQNLTLARTGTAMLIQWDAVTQNTNNQPLTPDGYRIYASNEADPGTFSFLGQVTGTSYSHTGAVNAFSNHFYRVTAVKN